MNQEDYKKDYFIADLHDQQMNLLMETEEGYEAGRDAAALNITTNAGIGILKSKDEELRDVYEMFLFVTDEMESYFARVFKQYSIGEPFTEEEIGNFIDHMNGAFVGDTKPLCRNF